MSTWFLSRRLLGYYRRQAAAIGASAFAIAMFLTVASTVGATAGEAVADATRARAGGYSYAVQAMDEQAAAELADTSGYLPVSEHTALVATEERAVHADVRAVDEPSVVLGQLTAGRAPEKPGEVVASAAVLQDLDVSVGSALTLRTEEVETSVSVVGSIVDEGNRGDVTVSGYLPDLASSPAVWLTDSYPWNDQRLAPYFAERRMVGRTITYLADDVRTEHSVLPPSIVTRVVLAGVVTGAFVLALLVVGAKREREPDVVGLVAAGMRPRVAWGVAVRASVLCLVGGAALGSATAIGLVYVARDAASQILVQQWLGITVSFWQLALVILVLPLLSVVLAVLLARESSSRQRKARNRRDLVRLALVLLALAAVLWLAMLLRAVPPRTLIALLAGVAFSAGSAVAAVLLPHQSRRVARRRVLAEVARPLLALSLVCGLVTFTGAFVSAAQMHRLLVSESLTSPLQPEGSLVVAEVSQAAAGELENQYRETGGKRLYRYGIPIETERVVRVTTPDLARCTRRADADRGIEGAPGCSPPPEVQVPVNVVGLLDGDDTATPVVDADLVEDGQAGFLHIDAPSGEVLSADAVKVEVDPLLGGTLPGAVLDAGSPLAERYGLRLSGAETVVFVDFAQLSAEGQAEMRSAVLRLAGTSLLREDRDADAENLWSVAVAAAVLAFGLVLLLASTLGASFVSSQQSLRQTFVLLGAAKSERLRFSAQVFLPAVMAQIAAASAAVVTAWFSGVHDGSGFGWLWMLPAVAGVIGFTLVAKSFAAAPDVG